MSEIYVVILAGGEGRRLVPLTRALYNEALPKQFAVLVGATSLLQQTTVRALRLTTAERITVVVAPHRVRLARRQLAEWPAISIVAQPVARDTGPGILFPISRIRATAPNAMVAILPADHYFTDERPLLHAIRAAASGVARKRLTLVAVRPSRPETEYGWIVPGPRIATERGEARRVLEFVEKPSGTEAAAIRSNGGLWNTFISVGRVSRFWHLGRVHLPVQTRLLGSYAARIGAADEAMELERAYASMPAANFSSDLLAHSTSLAVVPVDGTGWSDWGSPERVFESLAGTRHGTLLRRRMKTRVAHGKPTSLRG